MESGEFHWTDGWYFKLNDDDSVRIRKTVSGDSTSGMVAEATIPAVEWQSILEHLFRTKHGRDPEFKPTGFHEGGFRHG